MDIDTIKKERADMERAILAAVHVFHAKTGLYPVQVELEILPIEENYRTRYVINGVKTKIYL